MPQIICEDLSLGYDGKIILNHLNFSIRAGDYFCIVGENGSGKSTLMKTMLHLQPALGGRIVYGEEVTPREIGYLPQQTEVQRDFPASVKEIVLSGCQSRCGLRPYYNKEEKALARQSMEKLGIEKLAGRCYRELSGGQQQRVLLARALCAAKKILFLDEPAAGLDPKVTEDMYELVRKLKEEDGITIVMISHDIEAALLFADHILHVGTQTFFGTTEEYVQSEPGKNYIAKREVLNS